MSLETFVANGQAAQAAVDAALDEVKDHEIEKLRAINPTRLLRRSAVRAFLLDYAKKTRSHKFTRVSEQTMIELNEVVRTHCIRCVTRLPSMGRTI